MCECLCVCMSRCVVQSVCICSGLLTRGGSRGGLRGLEHPPRSKFRFQRELTGVINSFSSAKTHCRELTARAPITRARSITTTPTMSMSMRIAKARGYDFVFLTMSLSEADLEAPLS